MLSKHGCWTSSYFRHYRSLNRCFMDLGGIWEHVSSFPSNSQIKWIRPDQIHSSTLLLMLQEVHNVHNVHRPVEKMLCIYKCNNINIYIHICNINHLIYSIYIYKYHKHLHRPRSFIITKKMDGFWLEDFHPVSPPASHSPAQRVERPSSVGPFAKTPTEKTAAFPVTKPWKTRTGF